MRRDGFTLIELVVVMVVIGILAVTAIPRMMGRNDVAPTAFRDTTLTLLRYAQKSAIAQRRDVCVTFAAASTTLTMASAHGDGSGCTPILRGADGVLPATATAQAGSGTGFPVPPAGFRFRARGDTNLGANLVINITGAPAITVEQTTGYVR
jgi:MSHA pilin protein MshC